VPQRESIIKIVTVVGVMEWVCLALWLFYSSLRTVCDPDRQRELTTGQRPQLRQLGEIHRDPPRLIACEQHSDGEF